MSKVKPATVAKQKFNQDIHFLMVPAVGARIFLRLESHVSIYTRIQNLTLCRTLYFRFGSARTEESHPVYKQSYEIGKRIAAMGFYSHDRRGSGVWKLPTGELLKMAVNRWVVPFVCPEQNNNAYMHLSVDFSHFLCERYCW